MKIDSYREAMDLLEKYPFFTYAAIRAADLAPDPKAAALLHTMISLQQSAVSRISAISADIDPNPAPDAIDAFLSNYAPDAPLPYEPAESPDPSLTDENLLPQLIKNCKYSEALAIIEHLNLNNPEKSIYFADQIRFLKKLILNQTKANF